MMRFRGHNIIGGCERWSATLNIHTELVGVHNFERNVLPRLQGELMERHKSFFAVFLCDSENEGIQFQRNGERQRALMGRNQGEIRFLGLEIKKGA